MRVLNIIQCANLGGMERSNFERLLVLTSHGHSCEMVSLNRVGRLKRVLDDAGIAYRALDYGGDRVGTFVSLRKTLARADYDALIMTGHSLVGMLAIANRRHVPTALCVHYHHQGVKPRWQWKLIYRLAHRKFDVIFFITEYIKNEALELAPFIRGKAHVLHNIIHLQPPIGDGERRRSKEAFGIPAECRTVGNAGWLIVRKRFDVFLRVAREMAQQLEDVRFLVAGDGPERDKLRLMADEFAIGDRVRWLGWQDDMRKFYAASDLVLFNSDFDALGRTPLEAAANGVPFVASILKGGLQEIVCRCNSVTILTTHDITALAAEAVSLLSDRSRAERLVAEVRECIRAECSPEKHIGTLNAFLLR